MKHYAALGAIALTVLAAIAWFNTVTPAAPAQTSRPGDLPLRRVVTANEWRDARVVRPGTALTLEAPPGTQPSALRVGLGPMVDTIRAQVRVTINGHTVHDGPLAKNAWHNLRFELPPADTGAACEILVAGQVPVAVGPLEFIEFVPNPKPNVLVYLVDTLRADHLGCYGYGRDTSPHIDALAQDAIRFEQAVPQSSWTRPAVASLLTATYPAIHGAVDRADIVRDGLDTVGAALAEAGYATAAFMSNPTCLPMWGFGDGFNRFVDVDSLTLEPDKDTRVVDAALDAVEHHAGRPWFLYVHTIAPHDPYEAPAPYGGRFDGTEPPRPVPNAKAAQLINAYDAEIAYTDAQFGRLIDRLKVLDLYDNTLIVFLSDHGEEFYEHGELGHGSNLYEPQLHVPLLIKLPGNERAGTVFRGLTELVDVAPTVLDALGIARPPGFQGRALLAPDTPPDPGHMAYASLELETASMQMARTASLKYIADATTGEQLAFDLERDPGETRPLPLETPGISPLERHVSLSSQTGRPGLHILVTGSLAEDKVITGRITSPNLGPVEFDYNAGPGSAHREPSAVTFEVALRPGPEMPHDIIDWHDHSAEQNHAHLRVTVPPGAPIDVKLELDGAAMPKRLVYWGDPSHPGAPGEIEAVEDLTAKVSAFDPAVLPRRTAVYLWYVPPPDSIPDNELPGQMRDALEALGYLN